MEFSRCRYNLYIYRVIICAMTNYQLPKTKNFLGNIDGKNTHLFVLKNKCGMQIALTDYGARLVSTLTPDKHGNLVDVVLGFDTLPKYLEAKEQYHGATVGRYANRIANGEFTLDGQTYNLPVNNGSNCLHGGPDGFHTKVWDRQVNNFERSIDFYYVSPDGEGGFPGELTTNVCYQLTDNNEIIIHFRAKSTKKTVLNLTNHAYFNLNGEGNGNVLQHILQIPSTSYLPSNADQIPLGEVAPVQETAFDFRIAKPIGQDINKADEQLQIAQGYDHGFLHDGDTTAAAASVYSEQSGVTLTLYTSQPSVHLYTGNFLADDIGKNGQQYVKHGGFCLEAQHYPDSPNHPTFPSVVIEPEEVFESTIIYKFGLQK